MKSNRGYKTPSRALPPEQVQEISVIEQPIEAGNTTAVDKIFKQLQKLNEPEQYELLRRMIISSGPGGLVFFRSLLNENADIMLKMIENKKKLENRNRKSNPETIRRNIEILKLREPGPTKQSQSAVGKKYKLTPRAIRKIEGDREKWEKLASELPEQVVRPGGMK